ncbi:MAG: adenylyl-sulfate kinase [Candidatus Micrarchaeia archaeon]
MNRPFVAWITGLPGSGKSTLADFAYSKLKENGVNVHLLRMDEIRKFLAPKPKYNEEERNFAYRAIVLCAKLLYDNKISVIIDATGHRRRYRNFARREIENFAEIYVRCPLGICMRREAKRKSSVVMGMYRKALERKKFRKGVRGLGEVIGVDVEYEEPLSPELVIDTGKMAEKDAGMMLYEFLMA